MKFCKNRVHGSQMEIKDKSDFLVVKKSGTANLVNLLPFINKLRPRKIVTHLCLHRSL